MNKYDKYVKLVEQVQDGNEKAFLELYYKFRSAIFAIAFNITHRRDWAQDIAQEVFITILLKSDTIKKPKAFPSWVKRVVTSKAVYYKKQQENSYTYRQTSLDALKQAEINEINNSSKEVNLTPEKINEVKDKLEKTLNLFKLLPENQAQALKLHAIEGMGYKQVAKAQGCSYGAARVRVTRARQKIKSYYNTKYK